MDWASAEINEIAAALAAAQGEFEPAVKRLTAKIESQKAHYKYKYADLAEVLAAVTAALSKNGIAVIQPARVLPTTPRFQGDQSCLVEVQTVMLHKSGQVIAFDPFALRSVNDAPQAVGSTLTYARRYSLQAAVGVAPEQDDDGVAGQGDQPGPRSQPPQQPQQQRAKRASEQATEKKPAPPQQGPAQQKPSTEQTSEQYQRLVGAIREWVKQYPGLFPDAKAVWECMRPVCTAMGLSSANIKQITDPAVFSEIAQPVLDAIEEYQCAQAERERPTVEGEI